MKSRTRNLIAVSTLWAGLAGVAVAQPVAADSPSVADGASGTKAAKVVKAAKGQSLVTANAIAMTGKATNGTALNGGSFQVERFRQKHGQLFAVGHLTGTLGGQSVGQKVMIPVAGGTASEVAGPEPLVRPMQPVPTAGACPILTLNLGPLDLDLLGLRVALDPVNLLIEAIPGDGNLLGNLLCGVAGLLDGVGGGGLGGLVQNLLDSIADLLNGLLGGL
jgi:hypothetical protein